MRLSLGYPDTETEVQILRGENPIEKVKELVEPLIKSMGYRLFDVEFKPEKGWVLRIILDKEGKRDGMVGKEEKEDSSERQWEGSGV